MANEPDAGSQFDASPRTDPDCGNGKRDPGEECDDGNTSDDGNGCDTRCKNNAVCGDTKVQRLFEACDDGNKPDDACSADCKVNIVQRIPVSYGGGIDFNADGVFDTFQDPLSGRTTVSWNSSVEVRAGFEVDTRGLGSPSFLTGAYFAFSKCCLEGQTLVQLHGYVGDGALGLADFTRSGLLGAFDATNTAPSSIDITSFIRTILRDQSPYAGFVLRAATKPPAPFSLTIYSPFSEFPALHPRLLVVYCVDADGNKVCD